MSRTIPSALLTALSQSEVEPFYAFEAFFDSGTIRFWTGTGDKTLDGNTYQGLGTLIGISGLEEVGDLSAKSATVTLSGVPAEVVTLALAEPYQGRECRVYFGAGDEAVQAFTGLMDQMTIEDSGEASTIRLSVESRLVELERPRKRRYTQESQQARYAGDTFFSFVTDLQLKEVLWGRTKG